MPVVNRDLATILLHAFADAHPLSPRGVKDALERVKLLPAASGSPGTRLSFGKWTHRGWMGAGYLVARRLDPDGTTSHLVDRFGQETPMKRELTATAPAPSPGESASRKPARTIATVLLLLLGAAALIAVAVHVRTGVGAERIANPNVDGVPRPVEPLWGFDHWLTLHQVGLVVVMVTLIIGCVVAWRRHPRHPVLLMIIATTVLVWQDPIMNWAPYAVYNPQLWHWPETWPLVSLAPTVEPFVIAGYATFYLGPFFPAVWVLRRLQTRRSLDAFVWRHPLISLAALTFTVGFVVDACLEIFLVRTQLYIYSQVMPLGAFAKGKWYQFPLIWESALVTLVMIPAAVLLYRDDTGKTQAEKLAHRFLRARPALGTFLVMFAIVNVAYFAYGGAYALIRDTKSATSVACPWPFPEAKVYDPQGFYAKAGQPGPYFAGIWAGGPTSPAGWPDAALPKEGGRPSQRKPRRRPARFLSPRRPRTVSPFGRGTPAPSNDRKTRRPGSGRTPLALGLPPRLSAFWYQGLEAATTGRRTRFSVVGQDSRGGRGIFCHLR